jgi:hypothetical protein
MARYIKRQYLLALTRNGSLAVYICCDVYISRSDADQMIADIVASACVCCKEYKIFKVGIE